MYFQKDSLLPENQEKLLITAAPYAPGFVPEDFHDIPRTLKEQVQKAVDCYNAGAQILHIHVREEDGKPSKRMSRFNEFLAAVRDAVPKMILQVGGSISFAPDGDTARWPNLDTRHLLTELENVDQVTIAIGTAGMNLLDLISVEDRAGTSMGQADSQEIWENMFVEAGPNFYVEHLKRLRANNIQPYFMLGYIHQLEIVETLIREGLYMGPLNLTYVAIGGGAAGRHPSDLMEFVLRTPDGAVLTNESMMRTIHPTNAISIALGNHVRVGTEDCFYTPRREMMTSVQQIEWCANIANELGRDVATADEARAMYRIGTTFDSVEQTLRELGMPPNRQPGQRGFPVRRQ